MNRLIKSLGKVIAPCKTEAGVSAVEVGATMLVFLIALFSVAEFGWFFVHQNTLTSATREGIRIGTVGATLTDGNGNSLSREDSIKKAIQDSAKNVMDIDPSQIFIFPVDADFTDPDDPAVVATASAGGAGAFMRVRVQFTHQFFTQLIGGFFGGGSSILMSSEGTYRNENFILGGGS
ncbi:MAG: pilus assembly protein [Nitrospirota bacterium]|nr:pilus assembly protein [Nitrospirota bacterium]MDH5295809.1 pilus assembly protein [Nitrospirota bacterium]